MQIERLAQLVAHEAQIALGQVVGLGAEDHERRRPRARLRHEPQPDGPAAGGRRIVPVDDGAQPVVQLVGGDAPVPHGVDVEDRLHQLVGAFSAQRPLENGRQLAPIFIRANAAANSSFFLEFPLRACGGLDDFCSYRSFTRSDAIIFF